MDVQLWSPVYCFHAPGTLRCIWIGSTCTPWACVHTLRGHHTLQLRWQQVVACDSTHCPISSNFQIIFYSLFFKIIGAATAAPAAPLPTPLHSWRMTFEYSIAVWHSSHDYLRKQCCILSNCHNIGGSCMQTMVFTSPLLVLNPGDFDSCWICWFHFTFRMANPLMCDSVWKDQQKYEEAEAYYQQVLAGTAPKGGGKVFRKSYDLFICWWWHMYYYCIVIIYM